MVLFDFISFICFFFIFASTLSLLSKLASFCLSSGCVEISVVSVGFSRRLSVFAKPVGDLTLPSAQAMKTSVCVFKQGKSCDRVCGYGCVRECDCYWIGMWACVMMDAVLRLSNSLPPSPNSGVACWSWLGVVEGFRGTFVNVHLHLNNSHRTRNDLLIGTKDLP